MSDFFSNQISEAPNLNVLEHLFLMIIWFFMLHLCFCCYQKRWFHIVFWWLQFIQIVSLYTWYIVADSPLSESLPFYHCRLAMLFILWAKPGPLKRYFAYLGLFGSLSAFIHPVFDPFAFPHLTFFTFVIGHYALTVNCMLYLLSDLEGEMLKGKEVVKYTLIMNMLILGVALLTGGNYGFLRQAPLVNSTNLPLNFFLVTCLLCFSILSIQVMLIAYLKKESKQMNSQILKK
ncbi:TPA: TIGR02206 family membrane protein [Streptococcus suis]|nr:TIGR02206 family membrane protein [Streptococcus suis]MDY7595599.1 TIGR02206 family membrane protein [Streptococcus suis]HEL1579966.1 TIGR02206 family membrane protein [Streptococcus suis]HEL1641289.1 TIGR02206 family membrane protein [Streptococcus suis]HEL1691445.1 TIGR02206 family membrane protein [Streptococcus suis]HEL1782703.1 TIGR02206 family membrane protein [Streptococcus suis]